MTPRCEHGTRVPVIGRSHRTGHMWAGWMCPEREKNCTPEWVTEAEIFEFWLDAVKQNDVKDDEPPF